MACYQSISINIYRTRNKARVNNDWKTDKSAA